MTMIVQSGVQAQGSFYCRSGTFSSLEKTALPRFREGMNN